MTPQTKKSTLKVRIYTDKRGAFSFFGGYLFQQQEKEASEQLPSTCNLYASPPLSMGVSVGVGVSAVGVIPGSGVRGTFGKAPGSRGISLICWISLGIVDPLPEVK